jgi:pilus assembly protein CpaE
VSQPIKTLVALDEGVDSDVVREALPTVAEVQVVGIVDGLEESWQTLQETQTDLLIVACAGYSDRALYLIEGAIKQRPGRPVVVLTQESPNGFLRRVFEVGADDVVTLPETPENLRFTLQKALARKLGSTTVGSLATAPMVCVLGPKGGTGKTLTATNLAVSLATQGRRVALVDLDLQFGDVALSLGLVPESTIHDLAKAGGSIDADKLEGYLATHPSGLRVLLAPTRPDHASTITVELLREVYAALRSTYDYVVIDTPPGFTPEVIATIDGSSDVVIVGMLDSLSLKNTKLGLETLELMGYDPEHIKLVLNRAGSKVGITADDVRTIVGRDPDVMIPSDREIPRALNEGLPIVIAKGDSDAAHAFAILAGLYIRSDSVSRNGNGGGSENGVASRRRLFGRKS